MYYYGQMLISRPNHVLKYYKISTNEYDIYVVGVIRITY